MSNYRTETVCVQGGYTPGNGEPRQIPIIQSTTFKYATSEDMGKLFDLEASGYFYSRLQNPTCDTVAAKTASAQIAEYLTEQGFNLNVAPIADLAGGVNTDYDTKTYGNDSSVASMMVAESISGYHEKGIKTAVGAFPGESVGIVNQKDFEEWKVKDALVYQAAINADCECMVLANVIYQPLTQSSNTICSVSENVVKYIREEMKYNGLLMTDSLSEEVVTLNYSSKEVAVAAAKAGVNIIYCPANFEEAYQAIIDAVNAGEITIEVINESVGRILTEKMESNS